MNRRQAALVLTAAPLGLLFPAKLLAADDVVPDSVLVPPEEHLGEMPIGEWRYTLPWALAVDKDRYGWLRPDYPARPQGGPEGTSCLLVLREEPDLYVVSFRDIYDYEWGKEPTPGPLGVHTIRVSRFE